MPADRVKSLSPWHIILVLDDSGSMSGEPADFLNRSLRAMVDEMKILSQGVKPYFKISVISFGSNATVLVEGATEQDIDLDQMCQFSGDSGGTNITDALRLAGDVLKRVPSKPTDFTPYVFVLTDGHDHNPSASQAMATQLKNSEVPAGQPRLVTIGIGDGTHDVEYLRNVATDPELYVAIKEPQQIIKMFPAIGTIAQTATGADAVDKAIANI